MYKKEIKQSIEALYNPKFKKIKDFILEDIISNIDDKELEVRKTDEYKQVLMILLKDKNYMLEHGLKFIGLHSGFNFENCESFFEDLEKDSKKKEDFIKQFLNI